MSKTRSPGWAAVAAMAFLATACAHRVPLDEAERSGAVPAPAAQPAGASALPATPDAVAAAPMNAAGQAVVPAAPGASAAVPRTSGAVQAPAAAGAPRPAAVGTQAPTGAQTPAATPAAPGGSSGKPAGSPAAAPVAGPASYDQGAGEREIVFGSVSSVTGLFSNFMLPQGARAYFKKVNAGGGVNGRQVRLLIYDDQWDATRHAALTRQALENDKVFAFVANMAPLSQQGGRAFVEASKVPVIGGDIINLKTWGVSPNYYPESYMESVTGGRLAGRWAAELGCKKVAGFGIGADESRSWAQNFEKGLKDKGYPGFTYYSDISLAETDYTPYVATAKSKGVDCLTLGGQTTNFIRLRKAQDQQNYSPTWIQTSALYDPLWAQTFPKNTAPIYSAVQFDIKEEAGSNPAVKEFLDAMNRFEPGVNQNGYALLAWASGKIAVEAVRRAGNQLTRAQMFSVLDGMTGFNPGMVPAVTFGAGPKPGASCGNIVQFEDGAWKMLRRNWCL